MKEHEAIAAPERTCGYCGRTLHGRTDQRYCNDNCRNNFNRKKRAEERIALHENTPEIFRIIKRNYEILKSFNSAEALEGNTTIFFPVEEFEKSGIDPRFFTSILIEGNDIWKFCFERGWRTDEKHGYVIDRPGQAVI